MSALHRDERRGHFVMDLGEVQGAGRCRGEVVGADLGSCLALTTSAAYLSPDDARTLADALHWWAGRRRGAIKLEDEIVELGDLGDLFSLLAEDGAA